MKRTNRQMDQGMPTIVFLGDSVTEGVIGASFVDRVRAALDGEARVINSGINGDTVVNMRWRVGRDVAAHHPDMVVVMSGLNDIATAYALPLQRIYYRLLKGTMVNLTPRRFAAHYRALLSALRSQTQAQIVLATPTILTEDPSAPVQALVETYANVVRGLAHQERLPLIDMRAAFLDAVRADPRPGPTYELMVAVRDMWAIRRGQVTYRDLTERRGFRLLCDGAHLAEAGADLAAATALPRIREIIGAGRRPTPTDLPVSRLAGRSRIPTDLDPYDPGLHQPTDRDDTAGEGDKYGARDREGAHQQPAGWEPLKPAARIDEQHAERGQHRRKPRAKRHDQQHPESDSPERDRTKQHHER